MRNLAQGHIASECQRLKSNACNLWILGSDSQRASVQWEDTSRWGFPDSSVHKEFIWNAGDPGTISGSGRSARERIGYPLQYSWFSLIAQLVKKIYLQCGWLRFSPWVGMIRWRRERLPTPEFWSGEFQGLYSPWGRKESDIYWATFISLRSVV